MRRFRSFIHWNDADIRNKLELQKEKTHSRPLSIRSKMQERARSRSRGGTAKAESESKEELSYQRSTPLDLRRSGELTRAELHGWFNLLFILCGFFVVTENYISLSETGTLAAWQEFKWLFKGAVGVSELRACE